MEGLSACLGICRRLYKQLRLKRPRYTASGVSNTDQNCLRDLHVSIICLLGNVQETVQAAQAEKAKIEDSRSTLTIEVEVVHFQAYLQAEMVPGRFLLAAERGKVEGRHLVQLAQNVTTVDLQQVRKSKS